MLVNCPSNVVETTLIELRAAGRAACECVVLWLGRRNGGSIMIEEAYRPLQTAKVDMFYISPSGMTELHAKLHQLRCLVAAQIHSHPGQAFHSRADDRWAIVRHEGALSIVVPNFAVDTTVDSFFNRVKVYRLSATGQWVEVNNSELSRLWLRIV